MGGSGRRRTADKPGLRGCTWLADPRKLELALDAGCTVVACHSGTGWLQDTPDMLPTFLAMVRKREGYRLDAWLGRIETSDQAPLQSFASGIEKDKEAVRAGLSWSINNGMVEGHVTKLKLLKRQGYGRAGFPLLRKRVLHAV